MGKNIVVVGKDMPDSEKLADGISYNGRSVILTQSESLSSMDDEQGSPSASSSRSILSSSGVTVLGWNKSSPISARTLILEAESERGSVDEAVLYFDEEWFSSRSERMDAQSCARVGDDLILSYQYLTLELLSRFEKKNSPSTPGTIMFLLKEGPCAYDTVVSPTLRNGVNFIASPIIAAASAAFASFAENIAVLYGEKNFVNIILARGDKSSESATTDVELGRWISSYLDTYEAQRTKGTSRRPPQWTKIGAKGFSNGFSLFSRK